MYRSDPLLILLTLALLLFSYRAFAAEIEEALDENFFLFVADMSDDESSLDPLSMLVFDKSIDPLEDESEIKINDKAKDKPIKRLKHDTTDTPLTGDEQP